MYIIVDTKKSHKGVFKFRIHVQDATITVCKQSPACLESRFANTYHISDTLCIYISHHQRFQKRFFVLDQNALRYYNKPTVRRDNATA